MIKKLEKKLNLYRDIPLFNPTYDQNSFKNTIRFAIIDIDDTSSHWTNTFAGMLIIH